MFFGGFGFGFVLVLGCVGLLWMLGCGWLGLGLDCLAVYCVIISFGRGLVSGVAFSFMCWYVCCLGCCIYLVVLVDVGQLGFLYLVLWVGWLGLVLLVCFI